MWRCDIQIQSVDDESSVHVVSDEPDTAWEALFVPSASSPRDPNRAPTEVAPSTPVPQGEETPSVPETPHYKGDPSPDNPAIGVATKVESKERMTQTPPLVSRLIQLPSESKSSTGKGNVKYVSESHHVNFRFWVQATHN